MKTTPIFSKEELEKLPFNYQYIQKVEGLATSEETANQFDPFRRISIKALNTKEHLAFYPTKVISKIFKTPSKNGKK